METGCDMARMQLIPQLLAEFQAQSVTIETASGGKMVVILTNVAVPEDPEATPESIMKDVAAFLASNYKGFDSLQGLEVRIEAESGTSADVGVIEFETSRTAVVARLEMDADQLRTLRVELTSGT